MLGAGGVVRVATGVGVERGSRLAFGINGMMGAGGSINVDVDSLIIVP